MLNLTNNPVPYLTVQAFGQTPAAEKMLRETTTNAEGFYQITYSPTGFRPRERTRGADLFGRDGQALSESPVKPDAGRHETMDLVVDVPIEDGPRLLIRGQVLLTDGRPCARAF